MLPITDTENPPDERSILLCLSYLCSRLMESSKEIFACILIQACYRKYRRLVLLEKKRAAALFIFEKWCLHKDVYYLAQKKKYSSAVAQLEVFILQNKASLGRLRNKRLAEERRIVAATNIQVSTHSKQRVSEAV